MDTTEAIMTRSSVRKYKSTSITDKQREMLIDAALAAPSGGNVQPWHFTVVENQAALKDLETYMVDLAIKSGDEVAIERLKSRNFKTLFDVPMVIFISLDAAHLNNTLDCGIAVENIALAAKDIGLASIILGGPRIAFTGDKKEYYNKLLGIPEGDTFIVAIAVGVPAETPKPHALDRSKVTFIK